MIKLQIHPDTEIVCVKHMLNSPKYLSAKSHDIFRHDEFNAILKYASSYYNDFDEVPNSTTLESYIKDKKGDISALAINKVYDTNIEGYSVKYLEDNINALNSIKNVYDSQFLLAKKLSDSTIDLSNYNEVINKQLTGFYNSSYIQHDQVEELFAFDFDNLPLDDSIRIQSSHNWINHVNGGGFPVGSMVCYIGSSGSGKSIMLTTDAVKYATMGKNVLYVTAEMSVYETRKRILSNLLTIPKEEYDDVYRTEGALKSRFEEYARTLNPLTGGLDAIGQIAISKLDTSEGTVRDITQIISRFEKQYNMTFDIIVVDYLGILTTDDKEDLHHMKLKKIAEQLKVLGSRTKKLVITAAQSRRSDSDSLDVGSDSIADSFGIIHTADYALNIIPVQGQLNQRYIKVTKDRYGGCRDLYATYTYNPDHFSMTTDDAAQQYISD